MPNVDYLFSQPNSPQEFGVSLPPAELRKLDFSALDFQTLQRAGVEYIRTYYPTEFNDFVASNGIIMLLEIVAYVGNVLSERSDILVDESFLPTCQTKESVIQHLALIDQEINRATPAIVDVEVSVSNPLPTEILIPAGTRFTISGPDGSPVYYEIYRTPTDFVSSISLPPGKRGVVAFGIEGMTATPISITSAGGANQTIDITATNTLDDPITVEIIQGGLTTKWLRVPILEKYGPNDQVYEVKYLGSITRIVFGDNVSGQAPLAGQVINVTYRVGGGIRGRLGAGALNESRPFSPQPPVTAQVDVLFTNLLPSSGGTDEETVDQAKKRAPREFGTHGNAVTSEDYSLLAEQFSHPVFGTVAKAVATVRTGIEKPDPNSDVDAITQVAQIVRNASTLDDAATYLKNKFINRNVVELYVLAEGANGQPTTPSSGLKRGLITYLNEINPLTDEIRVYDGAIKPVDVEAIVVLSRNADAGTVKATVENLLVQFFDIGNFDMGTGLYLSNLYNAIQSIPGIKYVNIFEPQDDIIETQLIASPTERGIGFNEVLTLGQVDLKFYFESGNFKVPSVGNR